MHNCISLASKDEREKDEPTHLHTVLEAITTADLKAPIFSRRREKGLKKREEKKKKGGKYSVPNYRAPRACRADRHKINTRPFSLKQKKKMRPSAQRFPQGLPERNKKGKKEKTLTPAPTTEPP